MIGCNFGGNCNIDGDTFNLPDLRGRFMRGVSGDSNLDPQKNDRQAMAAGGNTNNAVGSVQAGALAAHNHDNQVRAIAGWNIQVNPINGSGAMTVAEKTGQNLGWQSGYTSTTGGSETRPVNIYVNYIIKE